MFPSLTVLENLEMGAYDRRPAGATGKRNLERIFDWLPVLAERRNQLAGTLSGGEQQMLAIGRGLASSPKLLMLDEPSMGLAPTIADFIFERLIEIRRESGADHPAGRAARRRSAGVRRPRLRARDRTRRARRQQRRRCAPTTACARPISACDEQHNKEQGDDKMNKTSKRQDIETTDAPDRAVAAPPPSASPASARAQAPAEVKVGLIVPLSGL